MQRTRNIFIAIVFCAMILGPVTMAFVTSAGAQLPDWLTAEDARYLAGGAPKTDVTANLTIRGFASKKLQTALTNEIDKSIPCKATAILGNAALQRTAILASNVAFAFDCYPTFFGSEYCFVKSTGRLVITASTLDRTFPDKMENFSRDFTELAKRHPECQFVIYAVDHPSITPFNPTVNLVSNHTTQDQIMQPLQGLGECSNIILIQGNHDSADEYERDFYGNDHHWNALGALRAYEDISQHIPLAKISNDTKLVEDWIINGSFYRKGLMSTDETPLDLATSFSNLIIELEDGSSISGDDHSALESYSHKTAEMYFYELYYSAQHTMTTPSSVIRGPGSGTALLVADSYGGAIKRLLAENYSSLYTRWGLVGDNANIAAIEDAIHECQPSIVYVVAAPWDLKSVTT